MFSQKLGSTSPPLITDIRTCTQKTKIKIRFIEEGFYKPGKECAINLAVDKLATILVQHNIKLSDRAIELIELIKQYENFKKLIAGHSSHRHSEFSKLIIGLKSGALVGLDPPDHIEALIAYIKTFSPRLITVYSSSPAHRACFGTLAKIIHLNWMLFPVDRALAKNIEKTCEDFFGAMEVLPLQEINKELSSRNISLKTIQNYPSLTTDTDSPKDQNLAIIKAMGQVKKDQYCALNLFKEALNLSLPKLTDYLLMDDSVGIIASNRFSDVAKTVRASPGIMILQQNQLTDCDRDIAAGLIKNYKTENFLIYKGLVKDGYPISFQMLKETLLYKNYQFLQFILENTPADWLDHHAQDILNILYKIHDVTATQFILERRPRLGALCSFDLLRRATAMGNSEFLTTIVEHGKELTSEECFALLEAAHTSRNLQSIQFLLNLCKKKGYEIPKKLKINITGLDGHANQQKRMEWLLRYAVCSPIPALCIFVDRYPFFQDVWEEVLNTISYAVLFPDRELAKGVDSSFEDPDHYCKSTIEYAKENQKFVETLVAIDPPPTRSQLLTLITQHRYNRMQKKNTRYIEKPWLIPRTPIFKPGDSVHSRYLPSLEHLLNQIYDKEKNRWRSMPDSSCVHDATGFTFFRTIFKEGSTTTHTITHLDTQTMEWEHNGWQKGKNIADLEADLEERHQELVRYKLDMTDPKSEQQFYKQILPENVAPVASLCEYRRGTPHNTLMYLRWALLLKRVPEWMFLLLTNRHFYIDNTALMNSHENFKKNFLSFFVPLKNIKPRLKQSRQQGSYACHYPQNL